MNDSPEWTQLPDLAAERWGGVALLANDEFFAEKDNLLRAHPAEWKEHAYTDRGKWMDGWETRRRRPLGTGDDHDWCVIRLAFPGAVHGVVVDTTFFRGNYPAACALDGAIVDPREDLAAAPAWRELLPRSELRGDTKNHFAVADRGRVTHLRLRIFPDGGVARLRVHGEVLPDWSRLTAHGGLVDLAALEHGGVSLAASDMFFGNRQNLVAPGRPVNMSDGWETRRRRGPGHDWNLVRLGAPGTIRRLEIDTTHFRGNAPGRFMVEGANDASGPWRTLLPERAGQPHTRHVFDDELRVIGEVTFLRLNVYPDGGVARLRAFGEVTRPPVSLDEAGFLACNGSRAWVRRMLELGPFEDAAALLRLADRVWWSLGEADHLEAFAAHPRIGGTKAAVDTGARAATWSAGEQRGVADADAAVRERLAAANDAYAARHGFTFIVCATGKSAAEMLALLEARLAHDRAVELRTAAEEQAKITRLRLAKLLGGQ